MRAVWKHVLAGVGLFTCAGAAAASAQQGDQWPIVGRWDLTVASGDTSFPSWLEVQRSGNHALVGRFVGRVGSARPIANIALNGNSFRFAIPPQWESGNDDLRVEGTIAGEQLSGTLTEPDGARRTWTATRAPALRRVVAPVWGTPIALFDGRNMSAWKPFAGESQWSVVNGVLTNAKGGANLATRQTFADFKLHLEFRYPKNGNSGVYLRGRYEAQIEDSDGLEPSSNHLGGIYGFLPPNVDAARKPGVWQTYDITLVGRLVSVVLNGRPVITEQEIPGITGGALDSNEGMPGPIFLQGDHGPVEYRNIFIRPARSPAGKSVP
ncbi:MAG TPA: DUF1080 domain-containing protein [Gemmatimonadaceae bacterium]|nr:DUF1080 domain-containing protein [Gemmatimonadaceae bacterium]